MCEGLVARGGWQLGGNATVKVLKDSDEYRVRLLVSARYRMQQQRGVRQ